ncbi:hypothetical protein Q3G72_017385 [Acer saccharum]|nr:hypothetical protein Q3G72_017254 [Acer saccharum]KAK1548595.1 hypothetical protein Q3G72_017385 [Acer saccharum]
MQGLKSSPALHKAGKDSLAAVESAGSTFFSSLESAIDTSSAQGLVEATILHGVATSTNTSGAVRGKTAQADGHKADVNRLANVIPKK